ncbi:MAG: hypothetical protein HYZ72_21160 [Deltaproteobacteria bacterium]|nr:hypothetical protein [Deltaproteobacteria bacterium]
MNGIEPLELALNLAAQEAVAAGFCEITPAHLLIALSRLSDPDAAAQTDNAALRNEFEQLGIEPRRFRRRLRALLGNGGAKPQDDVIHRSPECRAVFALARAIASQRGVQLTLEHLLHATLVSLAVSAAVGTDPGSEIECPVCHTKMRPSMLDGVPHCSACGKKVDHPPTGQPSPTDAIPTEL